MGDLIELIPEGLHLDEDEQAKYWRLRGLMVKHFGKYLRLGQINEYSIEEMEEVLEKEGYL